MEIICIGEILIDFISRESGKSLRDASVFEKHTGGAPANVAVGLAKLGATVGFSGRVGNEPFGEYLLEFLRKHGVDTSLIQSDSEHKTRLAFVELNAENDRSFEFWERDPADIHLEITDKILHAISLSKVLHFGSLALSSETGREKYFSLLDSLPPDFTVSCFDPNYRAPLWESESQAKEILTEFASRVQVLKLSEAEACLLAEEDSFETAAQTLLSGETSLVVITRGANGCFLHSKSASVHVDGFQIQAVDTTGCGDAFTAGFLWKLYESGKSPDSLTEEKLRTFGRFANAAGAMAAQRYGAVDRAPDAQQVEKFISSQESNATG